MVMSTIVTLANLGKTPNAKLAKQMFTEKNSNVEKSINGYRRNRRWLISHHESLRRRYGGKYVVVYNRKIKAFPTQSKLFSYVKKHYQNNPAVVTDYMNKQKLKFLL